MKIGGIIETYAYPYSPTAVNDKVRYIERLHRRGNCLLRPSKHNLRQSPPQTCATYVSYTHRAASSRLSQVSLSISNEDCVPAQGTTSLISRLSEVYNSLKVCLVALVKGVSIKEASWSRFERIYPGSSRSRALRGEHEPSGERRARYGAVSPSLPRTIIVVDDHPSDVSSFICSVLDAHALPYAVQVINPGAPAFDHLAPRVPTGPHAYSARSPAVAVGKARSLASSHRPVARSDAAAGGGILTQRPTAAPQHTAAPPVATRLALGSASGSSSASWRVCRYCGRRGSRPACPAVHRHAAPTRPPSSSVPRRRSPRLSLRRVRPPRARLGGAPHGRYTWGPPAGGPLPRPHVSVAQNAASRRPQAIAPPRAAPRAAGVRHTREGAMPPCVLHRNRTLSLRETTLRPAAPACGGRGPSWGVVGGAADAPAALVAGRSRPYAGGAAVEPAPRA